MKAITVFLKIGLLAVVSSLRTPDVKRRSQEIVPKGNPNCLLTELKRKGTRRIYTNINFHNIDKSIKNEIIKKKEFNYNDTIADKLRKLKKLKNVLNQYSLRINKEDLDNLKERTKHLVKTNFDFTRSYYVHVYNKLKEDSGLIFDKLKYGCNIFYDYVGSSYLFNVIQNYYLNFPLLSKSSCLPKMVNYNSVNFLFILFTFLYFKSDLIYSLFKKKYAFIGEFRNVKTDRLVKMHTLSTLIFFFYKFFVLRLFFVLNSYSFFSRKLSMLNNVVHVLFFSFLSVYPYFLVQANWGSFHLLGSRRSKILGGVVLAHLLLIYTRLMCQNNWTFLKKWTDEHFFNRDEVMRALKEDQKTEFYVNLLNQYSFLKRLYLGNNKFYEILLHLHKYKYLLDIISPINSLFYIYIAHSAYYYLNNLSFAGIYISSFSLALFLLNVLSNKIDMYFLTRT
ncbi:conserved Plasmodium protein, unknown function [Plasmodium knowlesi strain H]|uniref:Apicoplast integral membrane protein n=3 Tax=Plasmodium knowlesi TaxID=5850 RepID=A0A5K1UZF9_PLAKH|nr:apicoplast integral membrane protein, putative [Plasmodium knowlesi strain H]OTN68365.1 Uncharacterized protein PKNOH_S03320400 [Plasmodium knowlesi]CAA9987106.1 apicoplast integral membrane protein, putative [Plasmodium knowlesi strain H]SBO23846.1 conserved Plasmodium protein, unknown function [Plasmodium knowlesi strain H]SBO25646.1 conserved Plasmodium protein, unknown function [Plasmodium knowlesi strain H]VVS76580.1 apicoplast integral membrane protein, putative [Plasmodium knowlesi s|eukprot:XP_002261728.1 hypothetical protein, conserved in Plasmodium species [Plasmodium knowlesi strain H]